MSYYNTCVHTQRIEPYRPALGNYGHRQKGHKGTAGYGKRQTDSSGFSSTYLSHCYDSSQVKWADKDVCPSLGQTGYYDGV
eukprot:g77968.t1